MNRDRQINTGIKPGHGLRRCALGLLAAFVIGGVAACASPGNKAPTPRAPDCLAFRISKIPQTLLGGAAIILQNTAGHEDYFFTVPQFPEGEYDVTLDSSAGIMQMHHLGTGNTLPLTLSFTPKEFQPPGDIKVCRTGAPEPLQTF